MLQKSLEPQGFPFCSLSGNPVEDRILQGLEAGEGRCRDKEAGHFGDRARQRLGLMEGGWEGEGLHEGRWEQVWTAYSKG